MTTIDRQLQVGQTVSLTSLEFGYEVKVVPADPAGARIVEIGVDYIVVDDVAAGVATRLPAHFIKAVHVPGEGAAQAA